MTTADPGKPPERLAPEDVTGSAATSFADVIGWFGERSVPVSLTASGITILSLAVALRENNAQTWTLPTFLGLIGFGALLVIAGCTERIVMIRAYPTLSHIRARPTLRASVDKLQAQAVELAAARPTPSVPHRGGTQQAQGHSPAEIESEIRRIRVLARTSPYAALTRLANCIDESVSASSHLNEPSGTNGEQARQGQNAFSIQPVTLAALQSFSRVQWELLKRQDDAYDGEVLRVIDSGAIILRSLTPVP
jgi:hypothetical protein